MADILDLRKMNVFGGGTAVGSNRDMYDHLFEPGPMPDAPPPVADDISGLSQYAPETAASARFQQLLEQYPERQDPSFARKITSMLGGLSTLGTNANNGIDIQDKILQGPNDQRLSDWEKKARPYEVAASQENQRNVNSRNLAALETKERMDTRKQDETERKNLANEDIKQQNADLQALKYANPDLKFDFTGPKVIVTNPRDGSVNITKYDTGKASDATKLMAAQQRAETMASGQLQRAQIAAASSEAAGAQTSVEAKTGLPVVINPRAAVPVQKSVKDATPIQRIPGTAGPSTGKDLAKVRAMSAEALRRLKNDFLVMPKDPTKGSPTLNPGVKVATGWSNWNPMQYAPESPQRRAVAAQKNLKDLLTLSLIGEMKEQSRTGATGFGQLTGRELDVLESAASRLDWAQDEGTLTQELTEILAKLEKIMMPGEGEENVATTPLKPIYQENASGQKRVSTDGGKTWKPYP